MTQYTSSFYSNPLNYFSGGGVGGEPSGYGFAPGGGPSYYDTQYIYLGYTAVGIQTGTPSITSISPASRSLGTSGSMTVQGSDLEDPLTGSTTVAVTGTGITLSVQSVTPAEVTLSYSIATNANTGNHSITLATRFGTSNAMSFNVGDPTPVVQSVSPNVWPAGTNTQITITGTGFGTNPSVTTNGTGVSIAVNSAGDTQISATVSVAADAPDQNLTVQVQSNGYGSGFVSTNTGQSSTGSSSARVDAIAAPVPQIIFNGNNIANGATQSVVVGQQIALTTSVSIPAGALSVTSSTWTIDGTNVGGYNASTAGGSVTPTILTNSATTFYWVDSGSSRQITYSYTLNNGRNNSATATFDVAGPTGNGANGAFFTATPGAVNVFPAGIANSGQSTNPWLEFGDGTTASGIDFQVTATVPASNTGSFQWVQLITASTRRYRTTPPTPNLVEGPGLDNWYPYVTNPSFPNQTNDSPGTELNAHNITAIGEVGQNFGATMYLLWDPALPSGCSPASTTQNPDTLIITTVASNCTASIPVPLGYVTWGFSGDAINTLQNQTSTNTTWLLNPNCGGPQPATPTFEKTSSYPTWTSTVLNRQ